MVAHLSNPLIQLRTTVDRLLVRRRAPRPPTGVVGPFDCARVQPLAHPDAPLPAFVATCPVAQKYRALLGPLDWAHFPEL